MFHNFLRKLLNDERLIQRLSESSFMRGAARIFASHLFRGKESAVRSIERLGSPHKRLGRFSATLRSEYEKLLEEKKRLK